MDGASPLELGQLLHAPDAAAREAAWERLIATHTRLLLAVARSFGGDQDQAMERYAYLLEKLRERDFHRLRAFQANGRARFSTWLTVAARRLCLDYHRSRYGRARSSEPSAETASLRTVRRNLADSVAAELDTDLLPDSDAIGAESETIRSERDATLRAALETLAPEDRLLLALRFQDDLAASKIATVMNYPTLFHVYRRLDAVLSRLRAILVSRGIEGSDG
jgi:RNA polymerase sigma factor (sigma-70 family)